jgi:hypothetical protein
MSIRSPILSVNFPARGASAATALPITNMKISHRIGEV